MALITCLLPAQLNLSSNVLREGDEGAAAIREAVRGKAKEGFKLYISEKGARGRSSRLEPDSGIH